MLGVVVLVVAVLALRHPTSKSTGTASTTPTRTPSTSVPPGHSSSAPATHSSSHAAATSTASGPKALPLVILNNTTVTHLAADAATLFRQAGWKVTSYGNYQNNILSTCAYYDPNVSGAQAAASLLQSEFPAILRVKPKFSGLPSGPIVVVLTSNFKTA